MMFRSPQPTDVDLNRFYSGAFSPENVDKHTTGMEGTTESLAKQYVSHVAARVPLKGRKVMEFGAGLGITSKALRDSGAEVTAVEPFAWEECGKTGITTYRSLEELPESLKFDVILSLEVVEHLRAPLTILRELRGRLLPSGWLYLATPNAASLRARLHRSRWSEFAKYGHMLFYTPATLEIALREAGFDTCARVKKYIRYGNSGIKALAHYALHRAGLEGELRFLAQAK